jgi:hypothetical protein
MTRVYVPATVDDLAELAASRRLRAGACGYAATRAVQVELAGYTDEELEFALCTAAAESSTQVLLAAGEVSGRRVVLVLEVPDGSVTTTDDTAGEVAVARGVGIDRVEAILADAGDVPLATERGALAWFAVQELADLLA